MIKGVHTMIYSSEPEELRKFFREKLKFNANDIGEGWLIFNFSECELGVHPSEKSGQEISSGVHDISFYCENIAETVAELKSRDVEFKGEIEDHGYGFVTYFKVPGNFYLQLYQPKYNK